jgi:hypothetical protein
MKDVVLAMGIMCAGIFIGLPLFEALMQWLGFPPTPWPPMM